MGRRAENRSAGRRAAGQDARSSSDRSLVIRKCEMVAETGSQATGTDDEPNDEGGTGEH